MEKNRDRLSDLFSADLAEELRAALAVMPEDEKQKFKRALVLRMVRRELPVAPTPPPPAP